MVSKLFGVVVLLLFCVGVTTAEAVTWRFDFTSSHGGGFFEVDGSSFVIPLSAVNPTSFNVTAADINVQLDNGAFSHADHYTAANVIKTMCTPGGCKVIFQIGPVVLPVETVNSVDLQLDFYSIWVPWVTNDQKKMFLFQSTVPNLPDTLWNDQGPAVRTVIDPTPLPAALPLFATGLGALGLLGWRRKRKQAA